MPKKFGPAGDYRPLKVGMLKVNSTHIIFTEDETALLNKGVRYNLNYKPKIESKH